MYCYSLAVAALGLHAAMAAAVKSEAATERYVRYGFTLQNTSDQVIPRAELWVCAPLKKAVGQELMDVRTPQPHEVMKDHLGHHILHFTFSNMPPYSLKLVDIEANLRMGPVSDLPVPHPSSSDFGTARGPDWLGAEPLVDIDDPKFKAKAPTLDFPDAMGKARAIFDWVRANVQERGAMTRGIVERSTH